MNPFKGSHFHKDIIMMSIRWYVAYPLSYRHVEELLGERGAQIDHATINRWVVRFSPMLIKRFRKYKRPILKSWRMDETYIKIKGEWFYYYRAVDKQGATIDFYLSKNRDHQAAKRFLKKAIKSSGLPTKINMDKCAANYRAIQAINKDLPKSRKIKVTRIKYKNNLVEQDHRFIKKIIRPMLGFKSFVGASSTLQAIELQHMIRKRQNSLNITTPSWKQFYDLVG